MIQQFCECRIYDLVYDCTSWDFTFFMRVKVTICHILNVLSQYLTNRTILTRVCVCVCVVSGCNDSKVSSLSSCLHSNDLIPFQTELKANFYIIFIFFKKSQAPPRVAAQGRVAQLSANLK